MPSGVGRRIVVLASRFNEPVVKKLVDGALEALVKHGVAFEDIDVVWVPGAWELPTAARWLLAGERYDGIVAVGAVIRGETAHFEYIAGEASRGLADASAERSLFILIPTERLRACMAGAFPPRAKIMR